MRRIVVFVDERQREMFRDQAAAEGRSLSEWLREAGRERLEHAQPSQLRTRDDLERFFNACDEREHGREPDWEDHLGVIRASLRGGTPSP